jgi:coenzyme F420-reducing hydrogenase beta subunit
MYTPEILKMTDTCTACGACVSICGVKCIELCTDEEGFLMPRVDLEKCIGCGLCDKTCHLFSEKIRKDHGQFEAFAGWSKDRQLVYNSSSGGIFSILSEMVMKDNGVVFGAKYNYKKKRLAHCSTEDCDISALRKSKYVESNTLNTFSKVKFLLKQGRSVLFCGTPCQVLGLKKFLEVKKVNTEKLLMLDFICHGVPSNEQFAQYLKSIEKKMGAPVVYVDFRSKEVGWDGLSMMIEYKAGNGKVMKTFTYQEDPFFLAFYEGILLRRSCYGCDAIHWHESDITVGDFWGRSGVINDDNTGISLVVANSEKGKYIVGNMMNNSGILLQKLELAQFSYAYKRDDDNYSLDLRAQLMKEVQAKGFVPVVNQRYGRQVMVFKLKKEAKKILNHRL